jgi:hypothetical protein
MKMINREQYSEIVLRGIKPAPLPTPRWIKFAEACYDMSTPEELLKCLNSPEADPYDCEHWEITPSEWREAIKAALAAKAYAYDRM